MSSGLVYLRPRPIAFVRTTGDVDKAGPIAWQNLKSWCARMPNHADFKVAYGLTRVKEIHEGQFHCVYEAGVEMPFAGERNGESGLGIKQLPGGAYTRRRHVGTLLDIEATMDSFRREGLEGCKFELDRNRPTVQIFLCNPCNILDGEMKVDLLLPISVNESAYAA